jgi:hypothetical protein
MSSGKNKARYDIKAKAAILQPGDCVLVRNVHLRGKHKLADKWSTEIYVVEGQPNPDIPVFSVRPVDGGKERVLHRNLLLPVGELRDEVLQKPTPRPRTRMNKVPSREVIDRKTNDDDEVDFVVVQPIDEDLEALKVDPDPDVFSILSQPQDVIPTITLDVIPTIPQDVISVEDVQPDVTCPPPVLELETPSEFSLDVTVPVPDGEPPSDSPSQELEVEQATNISDAGDDISQAGEESGGTAFSVAPERPRRERRMPAHLKDYVVYQQQPCAPQEPWRSKVDYFMSLLNRPEIANNPSIMDKVLSLMN